MERSGEAAISKARRPFIGYDQERARALSVVSIFEAGEGANGAAGYLHLKNMAEARRCGAIAPNDIVIFKFRLGVPAQHLPYLDKHLLRFFMRQVAGRLRRRACREHKL